MGLCSSCELKFGGSIGRGSESVLLDDAMARKGRPFVSGCSEIRLAGGNFAG